MSQRSDSSLEMGQYAQLLLNLNSEPPLDGTKDHSPMVAKSFLRKLSSQTRKGHQEYGRYLFPWNGRNQHDDALSEAVDVTVYLTILHLEHQQLLGYLRRIVVDAESIDGVMAEMPKGLLELLIGSQE